MTLLPFDASFDRAELKGKFVREVFENSASEWEKKNGQFLQVQSKICLRYLAQVSGIQVVYNVEAPPGSRVCSIKTVGKDGVTWEDLDDERSYPMVAAMYIATGGDGHKCLSDNK